MIDSNPRLSVADVEDVAADAVSSGTRLVVLDGLQSLLPATPRETRYQEVSEQVHALKRLARTLNIAIVVTSKLNRAAETRSSRWPMLHDLRDAGDIEDVANLVVLLSRDDYYEIESSRPGEADLFVAKYTHGPTRHLLSLYQAWCGRFVEFTGYEQQLSGPQP